jgi:hypothetical protein
MSHLEAQEGRRFHGGGHWKSAFRREQYREESGLGGAHCEYMCLVFSIHIGFSCFWTHKIHNPSKKLSSIDL